MTQHYAIVVKKHPDGYHYVPFDDDPNADAHRKAMIGHLVSQGHALEPVTDTLHVKLVSGPLAAKP